MIFGHLSTRSAQESELLANHRVGMADIEVGGIVVYWSSVSGNLIVSEMLVFAVKLKLKKITVDKEGTTAYF